MVLLHSNMALLIYVGTDDIVEIPNFDDIDECLSSKHFIALQNSESEHPMCKRHYDFFPFSYLLD